MTEYLLIESRDPFEAGDVSYVYDLAEDLKRQGNEVTLFLVQNGVLPARRGPRSDRLTSLAAAGVRILADDFSLRERGIAHGRLVPGIAPSPLDEVIEQLGRGVKALWH